MCGIVGYIGNNAAADVLLDGLKNLEYRGYDSAGMALNDNGYIDVFRASGKLCNLYDKLSEVKQKISVSRIGIGHIRWATHGGATIDNAHPHKSNDGRLVLVHNGIIENYEALKLSLQKKGYNFFRKRIRKRQFISSMTSISRAVLWKRRWFVPSTGLREPLPFALCMKTRQIKL